MKLVSGKLMAEIDRYTIEKIGIPGCVLMENAGRGVFERFLEDFSPSKEDKILIVCGKGNNGGDGFVVARYLVNSGFKNVKVVLLTKGENLKGDALINYKVCKNMGIEIYEVEDIDGFSSIIKEDFRFIFDAVLGTGLKKEVKGFFREVISLINGSSATVISIDIPSGLCSERGVELGVCVKAQKTYTFGFKKIGLSTYPGAVFSGDVSVIDISIPENIPFKIDDFEIDDEIISSIYRERKPYFHKGNFGHCVIIGGSLGLSGAVILSSKACLRAGCGLATAMIPEEINSVFESSNFEAMSYPVNFKRFYDLSKEIEFINSKDALLVGPGIGKGRDVVNFILELLPMVEIPVVIDADGLNILAENLKTLKEISPSKVITPHPGEFSRLTGKSVKEVQSDRVNLAKDFAKEYNCVVVLKGYRTVITDGEKVFICPKGDDSLATAGSGDVLSGIITSLIAQGYSPISACILGVYLHAVAGDVAANKRAKESVVAGDILECIHYAFRVVEGISWKR